MSSSDIIRRLKALRFTNAFNPYVDKCPIHDAPHAAEIREQNLGLCLDAALRKPVRSFWIARDLGHRGGRRTGLALTDERHLENHGRMLGCEFARATVGAPVPERTATVIWDMLERVGEPVFLWNVFPLHPHEAGKPLSNRRHKRHEGDVGLAVLRDLLEQFRPKSVVAIGQDAADALASLGVNAAAVRHPSYGGERLFRAGISRCYGI